ncbi:hypothetical protein L484_015958 [Morus notabilis]|uniref:Uncharacterized protein n=1 Tax=Morus notabilis TaxID=981085 RepID=W9RAC5_9ROSA|nr:hypothetical protein L484_015958 [Morus notabilis]
MFVGSVSVGHRQCLHDRWQKENDACGNGSRALTKKKKIKESWRRMELAARFLRSADLFSFSNFDKTKEKEKKVAPAEEENRQNWQPISFVEGEKEEEEITGRREKKIKS